MATKRYPVPSDLVSINYETHLDIMSYEPLEFKFLDDTAFTSKRGVNQRAKLE